MKVKLYTDHTDGRKICYVKQMQKTNPNSNCEFDYYVKINRDTTIEKMIAVVIDDQGRRICKAEVKRCWSDPKASKTYYFGITICGNRVVYDTVTTLCNRSEGSNTIFVVEYTKDADGNQLYDAKGNPISKTRRVSLSSVKNVDSNRMSYKMQKLIHGYNKWHL